MKADKFRPDGSNRRWAILANTLIVIITGKLVGVTMNDLKVRFNLSKRQIAYTRSEYEQKMTEECPATHGSTKTYRIVI